MGDVPLPNRVTPFGALIATPERGLVYGNRGCLHDDHGRLRRRYAGRRWIACQLEFRGWKRARLMAPGRFTELFFLDEATAFAAGHRPCALCRRADYNRLTGRWAVLHPDQRGADAIDLQLHSERLDPASGGQRTHQRAAPEIPDGGFVRIGEDPWLTLGDALLRWTPAGYTERQPRPTRGDLTVLTPPSLLAVLAGGWAPLVPLLHPSAIGPLGR